MQSIFSWFWFWFKINFKKMILIGWKSYLRNWFWFDFKSYLKWFCNSLVFALIKLNIRYLIKEGFDLILLNTKSEKNFRTNLYKIRAAWYYTDYYGVVRLKIVVLQSTFSEFWYYAFRFMNIKIRIFIVLKSVQSACNPERYSRKFLSI